MAIHALKLKPETLIGCSAFDINTFKYAFQLAAKRSVLITPPARRARRSFKFAPFLGFFSVSEVGAALMGDTAEHSRFEPNI